MARRSGGVAKTFQRGIATSAARLNKIAGDCIGIDLGWGKISWILIFINMMKKAFESIEENEIVFKYPKSPIFVFALANYLNLLLIRYHELLRCRDGRQPAQGDREQVQILFFAHNFDQRFAFSF